MTTMKRALLALLAAGAGALPALGGTFAANFDDATLPAGSVLFGDGVNSGVIEATGGAGNTGCVKLTKNLNSLQGSFIVNDLDGGLPVNGFTAQFKMRLGGGSAVPADGCSFCVGSDVPDGTFGEAGVGSGLRIGFDIYDNTDGNPNNDGGEAPSFNVWWNNVLLVRTRVPLATMVTNTFVDVLVRINPTGTLDLSWNGTAIHTNLAIGYQPIAGARFGWGGRTGGLNTNQFIDDVSITTTTGTLVPYISRQPISVRVASGYPALFNVVDNGAEGAAYQWERRRPGEPGFTPLGVATPVLTTAPLTPADSGTQYRVVISNISGFAESTPATVEVVDLSPGVPSVSFNFNDAMVPAGSNAYGTALVQATGGVGDTACMVLTEAVNGQAGTWTVDDLNGGQSVESIEVAFKLQMGGGTAPPADGFGFHWAPDLPTAGFPVAEEPVGNGLSVTFDVYNSGNNEAPAIDVFWLRNRVGGVAVPLEFLNTQGAYQDVFIRLSAAGRIDVMFNGLVLVYQLQVPGWTAFSQANYGFSARTGGLNQRHAIDDVSIRSVLYAGPIGVVSPPQNVTTLPGRTATFSVTSNDPLRAQYQWQWKAAGAPDFSDIGGATSQTYTTPAVLAADNGSEYRCRVFRTESPSSTFSDAAVLTVLDLARPATPEINDTFDDGTTVANTGTVPAAVQTLSGNATILPDGGTAGSGSLRLTEAINTQFGTLVIDNFRGTTSVGGFTAAMNVQITGANPADGWAFSWSDNIAPAQAYTNHERGIGDDLRVAFICYGPNGIGVEVYWQGVQLTKVLTPLELLQTAVGSYEEVIIRMTQDVSGTGATLSVAQDGVVIVNGLLIPGFQGMANGRFAIGARTGGLNQEHRYDDVCIRTDDYTGPIRITQQPRSATICAGLTTTLSVAVNDPGRTSFRWQQRPAGAPDFTDISGPEGAAASYTTPALTAAQSGIAYRCVCTAPSNTLTSDPAVITVVDPAFPTTWQRVVDFNDGLPPADGLVFGSAAVLSAGGAGGTGMVQLTPAVNGLTGSFVLADQNGGVPVRGFTTQFLLRTGDATTPPADGSSFVWAPEALNAPFGETGAGSGLIISFDIYDNGGGEAPAIEAVWNGVSLGNINVPLTLLQTDADFADVLVRVNPGGTLDVIFDKTIIFWQTPIPGFTPLSGANFGWGARTGGLNAAQEVDEIRLSTVADAAPGISIGVVGGNIVITYDGILQSTTGSAAGLNGWTDVPGATSPWSVPLGTATERRFWRARR